MLYVCLLYCNFYMKLQITLEKMRRTEKSFKGGQKWVKSVGCMRRESLMYFGVHLHEHHFIKLSRNRFKCDPFYQNRDASVQDSKYLGVTFVNFEIIAKSEWFMCGQFTVKVLDLNVKPKWCVNFDDFLPKLAFVPMINCKLWKPIFPFHTV